jgi:hypothetical protein
LLCGPSLDLGSQPELYATRAEVKYGLRHVCVPPLILRDGVSMSKAEDLSNALRVEKVLGVDLWRHLG